MGDYGAMPKCDCKGTGYHGTKCAIPDCPAVGGTQCPEYHHCEPNKFQPGKPGCVCDDSSCECPVNYCNGRGTCQVQRYTDGLAKYVCNCYLGAFGDTCIDSCDQNSCKNNGTCTMDGGSHACTCPYGWEGKSCEKKKSCLEHADLCLNEALCSQTGNCICQPGFDGQFCQFRNACFGQVCTRNTVCIVTVDGRDEFTCQCIDDDDCNVDNSNAHITYFSLFIGILCFSF